MPAETGILIATAATIGVVHTLLGPDHYLPFVALARSRSWSLRRTVAVTAVCGVGHVLGSIALGFLGLAFGWALSGLVDFAALRGTVAGWLLLAFGLAYTAWGVRRALLQAGLRTPKVAYAPRMEDAVAAARRTDRET